MDLLRATTTQPGGMRGVAQRASPCRVGGWRAAAVRAARFQPPPVEPCMRFSRTRLTDAVHRRHSVFPARP